MIDFVRKLKKEVEADVHRIEAADSNSLKKSLLASQILGNAFERLKTFIIGYQFRDDAEEIHFFKHIKPLLCSHLIYYRKVYNIEMNRPVGSLDAQRTYLLHELDRIHEFQQKRQDFYRYLRSGATSLDCIYFMRGKTDMELYLESFYYERDPLFSTNCDFKVARIMANDMLQGFLQGELQALDIQSLHPGESLKNKITITARKTEIIELIYGLDGVDFFGRAPLTLVAAHIEETYGIKLGNVSRAFSEMKLRNEPTPFLNRVTNSFLKRVGRQRKKNRNKGNNSATG